MAISFRGTGTTASGITGVTSLTFAAPTGTVSTDLVFIVIAGTQGVVGDGLPTLTPPSGWTLAKNVNDVNPDLTWESVYWGLGSAAFTAWTIANVTDGILGWSQGYIGVDNTTPMDATAVGQSNASGTVITAPSITTVTANAWLVGFFFAFNSAASGTFSAEFGTHRKNDDVLSKGGLFDDIDSCDAAQAVAGASGTKTVTYSQTAGNGNIGILAALRPAGAAAGPPWGWHREWLTPRDDIEIVKY